jgi:hypothetical protein
MRITMHRLKLQSLARISVDQRFPIRTSGEDQHLVAPALSRAEKRAWRGSIARLFAAIRTTIPKILRRPRKLL